MAMTRPDRELIAQVMLFSQGFRTAESLASKIVPFFNLCDEQLSPQPHYDFGLRALKAVLASAGILKRERLQTGSLGEAGGFSDVVSEQLILIQSVTETIVPKLVADDVPLLTRWIPFSLHQPFYVSDEVLQSLGRCVPWNGVRSGRPECTARKDQRSLCGAPLSRGREVDRQNLTTIPDPENPTRLHDGRPLWYRKDQRLERLALSPGEA